MKATKLQAITARSNLRTGAQPIVEVPAFAAYKSTVDGTKTRYDYVRNLTHEQCRDEVRFPLGLQYDKVGAYVWTYGANNGYKF